MPPTLAAFAFEPFLVCLVWIVMLVFNLWMFQKTKGQGNLIMLVGAGILALVYLLWAFASVSTFTLFWMPLIGTIVLVFGFYKTAKPIVDQEIGALKTKLHDVTAEKRKPGAGGGTP